jgi:uncharacterized protein
MDAFFPLGLTHYLLGGALLGAGVVLLFLATGLIGGMSTVFTSSWSYVSKLAYFQLPRFTGSRLWRLFYAAGLVMGAVAFVGFWPGGASFQTQVPWWQLLGGGVIAGFGARMSNGCTSGHGICGMASFNLPSILAVCIFLLTAMVTANLVPLLGGF